MKEAWKRSLKYLLILPIIIVAVVVVVLTLPSSKTDALKVSATDIVLNVGEVKSLSYNVNIKQAVCSFEVSDETKANINEREKKIVGLSEGKTTLTVTAKYGNETSVVTVGVTVLDTSNTPTTPENPSNEGEQIEESEEIKVIFDNNEVDELVLNRSESYSIKLECEESSFTFRVPSELNIVKLTTGLYKITTTKEGYYTITIQTPSYQRTIEVVVK